DGRRAGRVHVEDWRDGRQGQPRREARPPRRPVQPGDRRLPERLQARGRQGAGRVRVARARGDGRLLPGARRAADDPAARPRRRARTGGALRRPPRRRALPARRRRDPRPADRAERHPQHRRRRWSPDGPRGAPL
ncbi:MAG: hypothetical protein AVDCRST_MAG79-798, partial [uncultured Thermoleophilia bacterium]